MNNTLQAEAVDYFVRISRMLWPLQKSLRKLFPKLNLIESGHYDETSRLSPDEFRAAVWRYDKLGFIELVEQFNQLSIEPIGGDLRRLKPQIDGINLDGLIDSMCRLDTMLRRCTLYTSEIDPFDESGVSVNVVGGIDELIYSLHDLADIIGALINPVTNQGPKSLNTLQESQLTSIRLIADANNIKLSHPQIAILYHINGWLITNNNANDIAQKYGQTSGQKLKEEFGKLASEEVRTAQGKNTVKNYKQIENLILPKYKAQYDKELARALRLNEK